MNYSNNIQAQTKFVSAGLSGDGQDAVGNGSSINRDDLLQHGGPFNTAMLVVDVKAINGAPSAMDLQFTLEHSDDGSSWSQVTGEEKIQSSALEITAVGEHTLSFRPPSLKQYLRAVRSTIDFTGGTDPTVDVGGVVFAFSEPRQV